MTPLASPVPVASLPELFDRIAEALGVAFEPAAPTVTRDLTTRGALSVQIERTEWVGEDGVAWLVRETGDNGATHSAAWEAHFHAEAELILPTAQVRLVGQTWGADALQRFSVEAEPTLAGRVEEVLRGVVPG